MRDITMADLQKFADKQAENFATIQLDLNGIMAFLQLLLNLETYRVSQEMKIPFETAQHEMNQTLLKIKANIDRASVESVNLIDELQKKKQGH